MSKKVTEIKKEEVPPVVVPEIPEVLEETATQEVVSDPVVEEEVKPEEPIDKASEPELVQVTEVVPQQKEIKESDEIGFLYSIMDTMEIGGWGKALHPMIKSRIEYLRTK